MMLKHTIRYALPLLALCSAFAPIAGCGGSSSSGGGSGGSVFNLPPNSVVITSMDTTSGPIAGGSIIHITGSGFAASPISVFVGVNKAANQILTSDTALSITTPQVVVAGTVDVRIVNSAGISPITPADKFTYTGSAGGGGGGVPTPADQYDFDFSFGGTSKGAVMGPVVGIGVDSSSHIWAVDNGGGPRLWEFDESGNLLNEFPELGPTATAVGLAVDHSVGPGIDLASKSTDGITVTQFNGTGAQTEQSLIVAGDFGGIGVDLNNNVYLATTGDAPSITVYGPSLVALQSTTIANDGYAGLAVSPGGDVFLTDTTGTLITISLVTGEVTASHTVGDSARSLSIPATDANAFFIDPTANIGRKTTLAGIEVASIGDQAGAGELNGPTCLSVNATDGLVFVGDKNPNTGSGRIMVYNPPGSTGSTGGPPLPPSVRTSAGHTSRGSD